MNESAYKIFRLICTFSRRSFSSRVVLKLENFTLYAHNFLSFIELRVYSKDKKKVWIFSERKMTKTTRKSSSPQAVTERILAECHEIYTDEENGLLGIAKSLGKLIFTIVVFFNNELRSRANGATKENNCDADW